MIQSLQRRFGLSEIQANVIFYQLQRHFSNNVKNSRVPSDLEDDS
jgi:hypothetical protein